MAGLIPFYVLLLFAALIVPASITRFSLGLRTSQVCAADDEEGSTHFEPHGASPEARAAPA